MKGGKKMKNKFLGVFAMIIAAICIYGPNIPSGQYSYSPEIPEEIRKLRRM